MGHPRFAVRTHNLRHIYRIKSMHSTIFTRYLQLGAVLTDARRRIADDIVREPECGDRPAGPYRASQRGALHLDVPV